jgi:thiamine kinase-like enzyme
LAEIHAAWWDHPDLERVAPKRTREECEQACLRYRDMARTFFEDNKKVVKKEFKDIFLDFEKRYGLVDQRFLTYRNISLVHRDAHFRNFMYPKDMKGSVRMIDWDSWRIDVPTNDISYYMAIHWYPERRQLHETRLLERYFDHLLSYGIKDYSQEMFLNDYKISVLSALYLAPVQYKIGLGENIWLPNFERTCLALVDLNCKDAFLP